jgi:NAD(P)-dependent dehydrogenase (short-subunit alcohol dehydrogenase family)
MNLNNKLVLITGAGSGIGRATAQAAARKNARLILCDINDATLSEIKAELGELVVATQVVDVSNREAMQEFSSKVLEGPGVPDVIINNAGVGLAGGLLDISHDDLEWVMNINFWGVFNGCKAFGLAMAEAGKGGHIVNVASAAGYQASAGMMGYNASKFAVFGFSDALREDMRPFGIGVSTICPGVVHTNIINDTRMSGAKDEGALRERVDKLYRKRNYGPEKVASAIIGAIEKNKGILPVTPEAWFMYLLNRISPRLAYRLLGRLERSSAPELAGSSFTHPDMKMRR